MNYKRFENETDEQLILRICEDKERIGTWRDVADVLNKLLGENYGESKYRKQYQSFQKMMSANRDKYVESDKQIEEINEKIRELERAKVQYRDWKNAWSKQNYAAERINETLNILEEKLSNQGKVNFEVHKIPKLDGDTDLLVVLSDLHLGQCFSSVWGKYNSNIAKSRLNQYLNEVIRIGKLHNTSKVHVALLGDLISGNIHKTIQISNKENVIEQIKLASEYISSFCYELTKEFEHVYLYEINGNHGRIDKKDDAVKDERLDALIGWSVCNMLSHIKNFHSMLHRKFDTTIGEACIRNKNYLLVHGDYDDMTKQGISNLSMMLGWIPQYVVMGHKHTPAMGDFSGVRVYQSGSLSGSGDDYTIQKRLSGKPSQLVLVCNDNGVECSYNVDLD